MTRSRLRAMLSGAVFGTILGALVCLGLFRGLAGPVYIDLVGFVLSDSASYPDSRMNNRIFLEKPQVAGPVYLTSKAIAINDLYGLVDQSVRLRGEFRRLTLTTGESILELEVKDVLKTGAPG